MKLGKALLVGMTSLAAIACSASNRGSHDLASSAGGSDLLATTTSGSGGAGQGGSMENACPYPMGPFGTAQGKVANGALHWQGFAEGATDPSDVKLADYYDCDGSKGIGALLVDVSATWCEACQAEAQDLHARAKGMEAKGVRVITLMIEDEAGQPASVTTARQWKMQYQLDSIATVADPAASLLPPASSVGLPYQVLVDPRTMRIVSTIEGYSGEYSDVLALAAKNAK